MAIKASDVMTRGVHVIAPEQTIAHAAALMRDKDVGSVAIGSDDKLVGILTDRDIAVRAIASDKGPDTPVREIMSDTVHYCFENDDVEAIARNMAGLKIRRVPVVDREQRLVGFIAMSNIAESGDRKSSAVLLKGTATPH
ncbi:MAG: CBS domain-containing protein [Rhodanobacteraceae bacterium]